MWLLIIIGIILLLVGAGLFYAARGTQKKVAAMRAVATSSAGSVSSLYPGEAVEVQGTLRCDAPLVSQFSGEPCAYVNTQVVREYEEEERDADGRARWTRKSETVASNTQRVAFRVEDETGAIQVDPEQAEIDALQVVNRFEQEPTGGLVIGGVSIDLGVGVLSSGRRTLGYRSTEQVLRLDSPVYVLGVVRDDRSIGCAPAGAPDRPFIISYRSEDALSRDWQGSAKWLRIASFVCAGIGSGMVIAGVLAR